jgi:hypothetical protein
MERWATKDRYERETEEAERLVRPAPKVKPPRTDKRREDTRPERDPDIEGDPDTSRDPDLSLNFKNVGGSAHRVLAAYLRRADDEGLIKVRHRDTGRVVQVKPETLKAKPGEYEEVSEEEAGQEEAAPEAEREAEPKEKKHKTEKSPDFYADAGRELYDDAETDLQLKTLLESLRDPNSTVSGMASTAPEYPVDVFLRGKKKPKGIETLGDLQQASLHGAKARGKPKKKPQGPKPEEGTLPEVPELEAPPEKPRKPSREVAPPPEAPEAEVPPTAPPKATPKQPPKKTKEDVAKSVAEQFQERVKADAALARDWDAYVDSLPTTSRGADGKPVWFDAKSGRELPWEQLPPEQQRFLSESFEKKRKDTAMATALEKALEGDPKAREAVESMFDPESEISEKLASLREDGYDLNTLPLKKNLPELVGIVPEEIKTVGQLQRFVQAHGDQFKKRQPYQAWEKEKGPESEEFAKFAKDEAGATVKDGKILFRVGKKNVPWAKLSEDQKAQLHDNFQKAQSAAKWTESLTEAAHKDPQVAHALYQLGNPQSFASDKLAGVESLDDPAIDKYLPSLRNLAFPPGMTFNDVVEAAKRAFKPIPPPKRREVPEDEKVAADLQLRAISRQYPVMAVRLQKLDLHPDDIQQVASTYQRAKAAKLKPEQLEEWIKDAQQKGLYTVDPAAVLPPKEGYDKNGDKKPFKELTPEEQSRAYAMHRNEVIATTLAMRDMANETFQEMGIPPHMSNTLALARLSFVPGEDQKQRATRARPMAQRTFDQLLASGDKPAPVKPEDVQRTLKAVGDDPLARQLAVAQFQANDYQEARAKFLDPDSPDHIDERDPARNIAARMREASAFLHKKDEAYPVESRVGSMAQWFRRRVLSRLMALDPEKAAEVQPEIQKMDADDWDEQKKERDGAEKKYKKDLAAYNKARTKIEREFEADLRKHQPSSGDPYRTVIPIKSVKERLADAGITEPVEPPPLPPQPPGYDLVRKSPRGQAQTGQSLWRRLFKEGSTSERVAAKFFYSSCAPGETMGSNPTDKDASTARTGVYWGVDPAYKQDIGHPRQPHRPWNQAHARDLTDEDYKAILASAREWMKVPVLARVLDEGTTEGGHLGAVRDIQLRAALDLAIRDLDGGKYAVGLHPTVYNELLAKLGGESDKETLLTMRQASESLYTNPSSKEDRSMNAAAEIRKFAAEIAATHPGLAFDLTNLAFRVAQDQAEGQGQGQAQEPEQQQKDAANKYAALRGAVIRVAHENPAVRPALVPVLQMLKQG